MVGNETLDGLVGFFIPPETFHQGHPKVLFDCECENRLPKAHSWFFGQRFIRGLSDRSFLCGLFDF